MDLRKAFDTVSHKMVTVERDSAVSAGQVGRRCVSSHKILLKKLYHYGIRGPAHSLLCSYLANRQQFVSANSYNYTTRPINIGVPQGSILDPFSSSYMLTIFEMLYPVKQACLLMILV